MYGADTQQTKGGLCRALPPCGALRVLPPSVRPTSDAVVSAGGRCVEFESPTTG
jgi:hypothetical protein